MVDSRRMKYPDQIPLSANKNVRENVTATINWHEIPFTASLQLNYCPEPVGLDAVGGCKLNKFSKLFA